MKTVLETGASTTVVSYPDAPSSYAVEHQSDETASAVVTTSVYSRTAEGEVPQLQGVIESQGGGDMGAMHINPGIEVQTSTVVSGAPIEASLTGSTNV